MMYTLKDVTKTGNCLKLSLVLPPLSLTLIIAQLMAVRVKVLADGA